MSSAKGYLKATAVPLALLGSILFLAWAGRAGLITSQEDLIRLIGEWLLKYGPVAVTLVSLIENLAFASGYFPGSVAILTAMAATKGQSSTLALAVWAGITIGAFVGQCCNFALGSSASRKSDDTPSEDLGGRAFFLAFWHPQFAALLSLRAGSVGVSLSAYLRLMLPALLAWNTFWGITIYNFGAGLFTSDTGNAIIVVVLIGWIAHEVIKLRNQS